MSAAVTFPLTAFQYEEVDGLLQVAREEQENSAERTALSRIVSGSCGSRTVTIPARAR